MRCTNCGYMAKGNYCDICHAQIKEIPEAKTLPALKKELQTVFNLFIRLRDQANGTFRCISCWKVKPVKQMHAGHFHSAGHNESVRYDEMNCNGQCASCNTFLHGNLLGYREGLIRKYGGKVIDILEIKRHNKSKMGKFELSLLIQEYKRKSKELKNGHAKVI
jgi:NAD-dependent dihydropyrimidine dehydrogenase PreA subunit